MLWISDCACYSLISINYLFHLFSLSLRVGTQACPRCLRADPAEGRTEEKAGSPYLPLPATQQARLPPRAAPLGKVKIRVGWMERFIIRSPDLQPRDVPPPLWNWFTIIILAIIQAALSDLAGRSSRPPRCSPPPPPSAPSSARQSATTSRRSTRTPPSAFAAATLRSWSSTRQASCSGRTRPQPGSTPPTPTLCSSGCTASSWWRSTIRLMVSARRIERCRGVWRGLAFYFISSFHFNMWEEKESLCSNT